MKYIFALSFLISVSAWAQYPAERLAQMFQEGRLPERGELVGEWKGLCYKPCSEEHLDSTLNVKLGGGKGPLFANVTPVYISLDGKPFSGATPHTTGTPLGSWALDSWYFVTDNTALRLRKSGEYLIVHNSYMRTYCYYYERNDEDSSSSCEPPSKVN